MNNDNALKKEIEEFIITNHGKEILKENIDKFKGNPIFLKVVNELCNKVMSGEINMEWKWIKNLKNMMETKESDFIGLTSEEVLAKINNVIVEYRELQ